jgi:hypothetical protein
MKKLLTTIFVCAFAYLSIAQDNTLPQTGNVGVGTLNPTARLNVNGSVKIDSSLVINDSLRVNKTIRVMDKVYIEGKTVMGDNAVVKQNFKVLGNSNFEGNITVDGNFKLPNVEALSDNNISQGNFDFLLLNSNGVAKKGDLEELAKKVGTIIYTPSIPEEPATFCYLPGFNPTWSNGINKLYTACPEVNVGIRTAEPLFPLDVRGAGYFSGGIRIGAYENIQTYVPAYIECYNISEHSTRDWIRLKTTENSNISTVFLVNNDGGLYCTSARVRLKEEIPVPDFVFKPDYELMPLSEVKKFVQTNSHLPNIPSEKEIREDGLSLEEMQLKLLQKVEELTLYVIELDEKNKVLEEAVKTLKTK